MIPSQSIALQAFNDLLDGHRPLLRLLRCGVLDERHLLAALRIWRASKALSVSAATRLDAGANPSIARYCRWVDDLSVRAIPAGPALDLILERHPLTMIDKRWRKRKGWARVMVATALARYPLGGARPQRLGGLRASSERR
ncbi:MAG: hypothetical protein ACOY99_09680 [Pseudomonadota bacterium]